MKKILFLMLSLAVASSAIAGPVKHVQKSQMPQQATKVGKLTKAPVAYNLNVNASQINAPMVQKQQHEVIPCEGFRVFENMSQTQTRAAVTTTPTGTAKTYLRKGGVFLAPNAALSSLTYGDQGGAIEAVQDGNTVWFKNFLYDPNGYLTSAFVQYGGNSEYWIYGTISGNTLTIPMQQEMINVGGYTIRLGWGTMYTANGSITMYLNTSATEATFTINGDELTLNGSQLSGSYLGVGFVAYWDDDNSWGNVANYTTVLNAIEGEVPEAPVIYTNADINALDGTLETYYRSGGALVPTYDDEGYIDGLNVDVQKGYGYIFYADNGDVYMQDPVYGFKASTWVKGTKSGNKLTFPLGQYLYYWADDFFGVKTTWGTFVNGEGYTDDPTVTEVTYTIAEDGTVTLDNAGMIEDEEDDTNFTLIGLATMLDSATIDKFWYYRLDFYTNYFTIPGVPTNVTVDPAATTCDVAWTTGENNTKWNVRYREWVDPSTLDYFFEDFEADTLEGWWIIDNDGDGHNWGYRQFDDDTYGMTSASYDNEEGVLTPDNWLMTPEITLDGVVRLEAWGQDPDWAKEVFAVYIFVGDTATIEDPEASFIKIGDDVTTTADATEYTFSIPEEYWGQKGYVAIRHYNVSNMFMLNIDDIYVGNADGGNPWIYVYDVEDPATVLTGLTPNTTYEVQVQGANAGGVGPWTEAVQFTTLDQTQPEILRGDVDGNGDVNMDDLTLLINYLLNQAAYIDQINFDNASICDALDSDDVGMDDLTELINYLLNHTWND